MADIDLSQSEADALIAMPKSKTNDDEWEYPGTGGKMVIPLTSQDKRENFHLDISRGRIDLRKGTLQTRERQVAILVRLDIAGPSHRNPDGVEVPCPHLHLYREGFADKWAQPIPSHNFSDPTDGWKTLEEFMKYCQITDPPRINKGLFV